MGFGGSGWGCGISGVVVGGVGSLGNWKGVWVLWGCNWEEEWPTDGTVENTVLRGYFGTHCYNSHIFIILISKVFDDFFRFQFYFKF